MAMSCMSSALLTSGSEGQIASAYNYGKHVGNAFQLYDDVLDFEGKVETMGKERYVDLKLGLSTAPVLFAMEERHSEMKTLVDRKFSAEGDVRRAVDIIYTTEAIERSKDLAKVHAQKAREYLSGFDDNEARRGLDEIARRVVNRDK